MKTEINLLKMKYESSRYSLFDILATVVFTVLLSLHSVSQTSSIGNSTGWPDYLGWAGGNSFPLVIQNQDPRPISFLIDDVNIMSINSDGGVTIPGTTTNFGNIPRFNITSNTTHGVRVRPGQTQSEPNQTNMYVTSNLSAESDITVRGTAVEAGGVNKVGVRGFARLAQTLNVGVWAETCDLSGSVAARFEGDLTLTGDLWGPSDMDLKENIQNITQQELDHLSALDVKSFYFLQDVQGMSLPNTLQYGYIAQEVQELFPETIKIQQPYELDEDDKLVETEEYLSVDYLNFLSLGVAKFQQQDSLIEENLNKINMLQNRIDNLLADVTAKLNSKSPISEDRSAFYNVYPNPAEEKIIVERNTDEKKTASISIRDMNGDVIMDQEFDPTQRKMEMDISRAAQGIYQVIIKNHNHIESTTIIKR